MRIIVRINTNNGFDSINIEEGAINEFTRTGFAEGIYDATVSFECLPAFADPEELLVVFENIKEFVENIELVIKICKSLWKFLKKCRNYSKRILIEQEMVSIDDEMTEEEFETKIALILSKEVKIIGQEVTEILNEKEASE